MRVGKAEEDFGELGAAEEVGEEFHGVSAQACDVLVATRGKWKLLAEGVDAVLDVGRYLCADLETCTEGLEECLWVGRNNVVRNEPRINSSGSLGASATSRPPNPQPMSATVTSFLIFLTDLGTPSSSKDSCSGSTKAG